MAAVVKDATRIYPNLPLHEKGYAFPDPNSLAGLRPEQLAKKLCAWLRFRPAACANVFIEAGVKPSVASGAVWMSILDMDASTILPPGPVINPDTGKELKTSKVRGAIKELFGEVLLGRMREHGAEVFWHGRALQVEESKILNLHPDVVREMIWELFEHNFRYELQALDMAAAPSEWHDAHLRQDAVRSVFGRDGKFIIWNDALPSSNVGLQAESISDRLSSLEQFRLLMKSWRDVPTAIRDVSLFDVVSKALFNEREYQIILFYCQTFYDFFGRPPVCPHRIPYRILHCAP